jgi:hypothetical protein
MNSIHIDMRIIPPSPIGMGWINWPQPIDDAIGKFRVRRQASEKR